MSESRFEPREVQPADPVARRRTLIGVVVVIVVAVALAYAAMLYQPAIQAWFEGWVDGQMTGDPEADRRRLGWILFGLFGILAVLPFGMGAYLIVLGRRILAAGRIPLPGQKVIVDTPVRRGRDARRRGLLTVGLGALLIGCGVGLLVVCYNLVQSASG